MVLADIIGDIAACLTTLSFLPQAVRVIRTRETSAISLTMYLLFTLGVSLWTVFGVLTLQWSIILANSVTLILAGLILGLKIRSTTAARL